MRTCSSSPTISMSRCCSIVTRASRWSWQAARCAALLDFDYREVQVAQAIIANARSVMLVADSTKLRRSAPVRIAHISQIQTFVTDAALPAGLANICHTRGIEVIEAMPKSSADIDEPGIEPASTVTRLR